MRIEIGRPPFHLVWLDTWAVSEIATALTKGHASNQSLNREWAEGLLADVRTLTQQGKLVVPMGHQLDEIESGGLSADDAHQVLATLSGGVSLQYHRTVKDWQTFRTMEAQVSKADICSYPWDDLFSPETRRQIKERSGFGISVHMTLPEELRAEFLSASSETAALWENMRIRNIEKGIRYDDWLQNELNGMAQTVRYLARPEMLVRPEAMLNVFKNLLEPIQMLKNAGGSGSIRDLVEFFESEEFKNTPTIRIKMELIAFKLTGKERIKRSDVADIDNISSTLPFSSIMVMDNAMRDKVVDRLKLSQKYGVQVVRLSQLQDALRQLAAKGDTK